MDGRRQTLPWPQPHAKATTQRTRRPPTALQLAALGRLAACQAGQGPKIEDRNKAPDSRTPPRLTRLPAQEQGPEDS